MVNLEEEKKKLIEQHKTMVEERDKLTASILRIEGALMFINDLENKNEKTSNNTSNKENK